ncbi:MAG: RNA-binding protein [Planctomycetes bacterium]|nr:RNA-binding protein [Planctomycetota bacterium]
MTTRLYVGNLSFDSTEDSIIEAFEQDNRRVQSVTIMTDRETGRPRGFAFVDMASEDDARSAIEALDGAELDGRRLRVNEAQERQPRSNNRPARGGGGGGGRGGYGGGHGGGQRGGW